MKFHGSVAREKLLTLWSMKIEFKRFLVESTRNNEIEMTVTINKQIFSVDLNTVMSYQQDSLPNLSVPLLFLMMRDTMIMLHAESTEGIFRVPGKQDEVDGYKELFNRGEYIVFKECSCHTIAGLFKLFLRELPEAVIPQRFYDSFVNEQVVDDISEDPSKIQPLLDILPKTNKAMVIFIINFLQRLSDHEEETKMGIDNLAMVFSACMLIGTDMDPFSALTKTNIAKSCIAALIRNLPKDAIEQLDLDVPEYIPGAGLIVVDTDPIPRVMEEVKEREMPKKGDGMRKTLSNIFSRSRSTSQSKSATNDRGSDRSSSSRSVHDTVSVTEAAYVPITASAAPSTPHKRGVSMGASNKPNETHYSKDDILQMWDITAVPAALSKPPFALLPQSVSN